MILRYTLPRSSSTSCDGSGIGASFGSLWGFIQSTAEPQGSSLMNIQELRSTGSVITGMLNGMHAGLAKASVLCTVAIWLWFVVAGATFGLPRGGQPMVKPCLTFKPPLLRSLSVCAMP